MQKSTELLCLICLFSSSSFSQEPSKIKWKDFRGVAHCHSELSTDSRGRFDDIVSAAQKTNVDFIVMTDHWSPKLYERSRRGWYGRTLFMAGLEISQRNSFSALAFPLSEKFVPRDDFSENVKELRKLGSLVFAGHMELAGNPELIKMDGLEITNLHALAMPQKSRPRLIKNFSKLLLPWNWNLAFLVKDVTNIDRWRELEFGHRKAIPIIFGNDNHDNLKLPWPLKLNLASYKKTFLIATTHVWTQELNEHEITDALRKGRGYAAFEVLGPSDGFFFGINKGGRLFLPGSVVETEESVTIHVVPPTSRKIKYRKSDKISMEIMKDGKPYAKREPSGSKVSEVMSVELPGIYNVQISKKGKPWILSNSIVVQKPKVPVSH